MQVSGIPNPQTEIPSEQQTKPLQSSSGDPFAPAGVVFRPVSPALIKVRLFMVLILFLVLSLGCTMLFIFPPVPWFGVAMAVITIGLCSWLMWLIPRQVRALGWAVTGTELQIRRGVMFRSLTVVPLGRLQYVDVEVGPIARIFNMAQVKLHTASATTDATLPGIPAEHAAALREQIADLAEANLEGI